MLLIHLNLNLCHLHNSIFDNNYCRIYINPTTRTFIDFGRMPYFYIECSLDRLSKLKLPLLALRISQFDNVDDLDRSFQSPAIQTVLLVEVIVPNIFSGPEFTFGGGAARVKHWILVEFVGWNHSSDVPVILLITWLEMFCCSVVVHSVLSNLLLLKR